MSVFRQIYATLIVPLVMCSSAQSAATQCTGASCGATSSNSLVQRKQTVTHIDAHQSDAGGQESTQLFGHHWFGQVDSESSIDAELASDVMVDAVLLGSDWHAKRPTEVALSSQGTVLCEWNHLPKDVCRGSGAPHDCAWSPSDAASKLQKGDPLGKCEGRDKEGGGKDWAMSYSWCMLPTPIAASKFTFTVKSAPCGNKAGGTLISGLWAYRMPLCPQPPTDMPHLGSSPPQCTPHCNNRCCMDGDCNKCYAGPTPGCLALATPMPTPAPTTPPHDGTCSNGTVFDSAVCCESCRSCGFDTPACHHCKWDGCQVHSLTIKECCMAPRPAGSPARICEKQPTNGWVWDGVTPDKNTNPCELNSPTSHGCDTTWAQEWCAETCGKCPWAPASTTEPPTPEPLCPEPPSNMPHLGSSPPQCTPHCNNRCCMDNDCNKCYAGPTPGCLALATEPPTPEPVTWVLAQQNGNDCDSTCAAQGQTCSESHLKGAASQEKAQVAFDIAQVSCTAVDSTDWAVDFVHMTFCNHPMCCGGKCVGGCAYQKDVLGTCSAKIPSLADGYHLQRVCPCAPASDPSGEEIAEGQTLTQPQPQTQPQTQPQPGGGAGTPPPPPPGSDPFGGLIPEGSAGGGGLSP